MMKRKPLHTAKARPAFPIIRSLLMIGLLGILIIAPSTSGQAALFNDDGSLAETQAGTGSADTGGSCGWDGFMEAVAHRESSGNPAIRNSIGYTGYFQFGEGALKQIGWYCSQPVCSQCYQAFKGAWCQKAKDNGVNSIEEFMQNPDAQKAAFKEWMQYLYGATKKCHDKIGQQAPNGSCTTSLSGVLGGGHLGGQGGVCNYLNGGANSSDGATRIGDYVCCFKNFAICDTVAPGDPSCQDGGEGGTCGDPSQENCQGGDMDESGSGRLAPEYQEGPTESGLDLPGGPDESHLSNMSETLKSIWVGSLQIMTSQLTTAMVNQVEAIGMLFDAKQQLEVQRLMQQRYAEAHKDYQPSEQMCTIGTMVRHLASSEKQSELTQVALAKRIMEREIVSGDALSAESQKSDMKSRMKHLRDTYCGTADNGGNLDTLCNNKNANPKRRNRDIDYSATLDTPMTLDIDFTDGKKTDQEEDLMELVNYLFQHRTFPSVPPGTTALKRFVQPYQDMRSIIAMRGVARNSIASIIAQKTAAPDHGNEDATPFMRALIADFGIDGTEIDKLLGEHPSYYAQMEILTKKLYQNPNFIVNLYDKPANVTRIRTAMQAIKTMQDRDIHEALMRREMLLSMILELRIRQNQDRVTTAIRNNLFRATPTGGTGSVGTSNGG